MLPQAGRLGALVWCACQRQDFADLQGIVDSGRGDVPLRSLRFRCTACGSRRTNWVVTSRERSAGHALAKERGWPKIPTTLEDLRRFVRHGRGIREVLQAVEDDLVGRRLR
jgi:transposase-like protein